MKSEALLLDLLLVWPWHADVDCELDAVHHILNGGVLAQLVSAVGHVKFRWPTKQGSWAFFFLLAGVALSVVGCAMQQSERVPKST